MLATDLFSWGSSLADVLNFVDPAEREAALPALLDEAETLADLRAQSAPLLEYLTHREVVSALVSTALGGDSRVSETDDDNAADDRADASRRRRNVACEVLCSDSAPIAEALTATDRGLSVHLPRIEACLRNHAPGRLPRHVASTIEKLIMSLLRTKPCSLLNWLAEPATRRGMVDAVVAHLAVFEGAIATGCGHGWFSYADVFVAGIAFTAFLGCGAVETGFTWSHKTGCARGEPGQEDHSRKSLHPNLLLKRQLKDEACAALGRFHTEGRLGLFR